MFSDFDMHPSDMDIRVYPAGDTNGFSNSYFNERLQITMSHVFENSIPGKSLKWIVQEQNTNKTLGFIRFGSPTINSKPRNEWLGDTPELSRFNRQALWGLLLFRPNLLDLITWGGKLLAPPLLFSYGKRTNQC